MQLQNHRILTFFKEHPRLDPETIALNFIDIMETLREKIKKRKYTRRRKYIRRRNYTSKKRSRQHNRIKRKYKIHLTRKHKK